MANCLAYNCSDLFLTFVVQRSFWQVRNRTIYNILLLNYNRITLETWNLEASYSRDVTLRLLREVRSRQYNSASGFLNLDLLAGADNNRV